MPGTVELPLLKNLFDLMPDGMVGVNNEGKIIFFNKQAERMFGYAADEVKGKPLEMLMHERYRNQHAGFTIKYFEKPAFRPMGAINHDFYGLKKTGEEFPVAISLSHFKTREGNIAMGSVRDITEKKQVKELLRQSEEKYREIVEGSHEMIQSIGENGEILFVNRAWKETLGYTDDELRGLTIFDIISEESRDACISEFKRVMQGEVIKGREAVFTSKKGVKIFVEGSSVPRIVAGKVTGTQGFFSNITKPKKDSEALKKTEANLVSLLNNSSIGYLMLDATMKIVGYNNTFNEWSKLEAKQELVIGRNYLTYLDEVRVERIGTAIERAMNGETIEYEVPGTPETNRWYFLSLSRILENNEISGISLTCMDITDRKKAELELKRISDDIVQRNKDLEQFAYIISHNLRAPLTNIIGASEVLEFDNLETGDKTRLIQGIHSSVVKLDEVVQDLTEILRVNRDVSETKQVISFSRLLYEIKLSINHLVVKNNVRFITDFTDIDLVYTLRSYMYSIFYNLITNSIKFRQANKIPIITIKSRKLPNGYELYFSDNGMGMNLEKYGTKLFKLYNRFHLNIEGKGLGLFMMKTQAEILGGKISVNSTEGEGTEFVFTFENKDEKV